ncbi:type I restriction enzyme R subunit [Pseudomonas sp. SJZ079]|uniref:type I restriction endonuclease subunit R n=1 Tax=Pseudomonas sp. SJZ079 TaxID=2572887 RepID=UPI0011990121|nr:HsdR family type I site-specific deoxyribonuclease [Pseudomonas sp. SJZ079]TWC41518.1 type I restriction enzyme R subunit [Pseudomonas sp. SJZ079]
MTTTSAFAHPRFQEEFSAKIPALALLANLGFRYLSPSEALQLRGSRERVVLTTVLKAELAKRRFFSGGVEHGLSEAALTKLVGEISHPPLNEGLQAANQRLSDQLLYGVSVSDFVAGSKVNPTIALIDWQNPSNNNFHLTEELGVGCTSGIGQRIPDIVLYVNGLPLVVIEAKRPDANSGKDLIKQGISQMLRNQRSEEIPQLFAFSQLLLVVDGSGGRYGTVGTTEKFWAAWREEEISEVAFAELKNRPLHAAQEQALFANRPAASLAWYRSWLAGGLLASQQDKLLASLCRPDRLLELVRFYTFSDNKHGKLVARYQQVFGIRALIARIQQRDARGARQGGVIWHTTGSGKSITMLLLSKALIFHPDLQNCRVLVITDRTDLEAQLSKTFASAGVFTARDQEEALSQSGRHLAQQIGKGSARVMFALIQKFNSAAKLPECRNDSSDFIVLVDEGHRSQGGENHVQMRLALPNAAFVAFTGTPLLLDEKTQNKFGPIVHAYTMQRAVEDGTVTPLLYEERRLELDVNDRAIDNWFERHTQGLSAAQQADLKKKFAKKGELYKALGRLELIAHDISEHFSNSVLDGLKGQVACDSRVSAIRLKGFLDEIGLVSSALVMSAPDSREGNTDSDENSKSVVQTWWDANVGKEDGSAYKQRMIEAFAQDHGPDLLIVIDQLLTGFDEPRNAVLYIDKNLKQHNLIQAIARVNRLHPNKKFGLLIDYRGILGELDTTIAQYQDLATRTQGGYSIDDLDGLYSPMSTEYKKLPGLYQRLWAMFAEVKNSQDIEQMLAVLLPRLQEINGAQVDTRQKARDDFYGLLSEFAGCLAIALQSQAFFQDKSVSEGTRRQYKETVKQLSNLRQRLKQATGDTVDYDEYAVQVKKLMDKHVVGVGVQEPKGAYLVGEMGAHQPETWSEEKTRNEKDIIQTRVTKEIEQLLDDPYAQKAFSELLRQVIAEADALFDHPLKQYLLFKEFGEQVQQRHLDELPEAVRGNPHVQAYFGAFKLLLDEHRLPLGEADTPKWVALAEQTDAIVGQAVAEFSINPLNIEAAVRQKLLPLYFMALKALGLGMDQVQALVEQVVLVVRAGARRT